MDRSNESASHVSIPSAGSVAIIALLIAADAAAFAYTAGWFTPHRPAPERVVDASSRQGGNPLSHRVIHPKGMSFTREFAAALFHALVRRDNVFRKIAYVAHLLGLR